MGGQIEYITLPGIAEPIKLGDFVHSTYFSTVNFGSTQSANLIYFHAQEGAAMQGLSGTQLDFYHTNMPGQAQLPKGFQALVFFLSVVPPVDITEAIYNDLQAKVLFEFINGPNNKVADSGTLSHYPAGGGLYGTTNLNAAEAWNNGFPSGGSRTPYAIPHSLDEQIQFTVVARLNAALTAPPTGTQVKVLREGVMRRTVS